MREKKLDCTYDRPSKFNPFSLFIKTFKNIARIKNPQKKIQDSKSAD